MTAFARVHQIGSPRRSSPSVGAILRVVGAVAAIGVFSAGALAQPGEKPISRPATPPTVEPGPQPVGQPIAPGEEQDRQTEIFDDGKAYPVSRFVLKFLYPHPGHPAIEELEKTEVELGQGPEGYVRPREGIPTVKFRLADLPDGPVQTFRGSAIDTVIDALLDGLNKRGVVGVYIFVSPDDVKVTEDKLDPEFGQDLRAQGNTNMHLEIFTGTVSQVRTLASGERIPFSARIDHPAHKRIRERSPVQPAPSQGAPDREDLIRKDQVDNFLFRLNRHPGRRVDVALTTGEDITREDGTKIPSVSLDYLVSENKPWTAYFQVSNTGTKETAVWRERFGFTHNQLTGRDDILSLDFITSGFDQSNAFIGSYETPIFKSETLRGRVYGTWSEFTASDVGIADGNFDGEDAGAGGEVIWNFFQDRELFLDLIGGIKWQNVEVTNQLADTTGDSNFLFPYLGVRLEKYTDVASTSAMVNFEFNIPGVTASEQELNLLGRNGVDDSWAAMQWDVTQTFFLEPLLARKSWLDAQNGSPTLAHEIALSFKGQYAFGARLVPNFEQVAGGLYTVRGYPESAAAGDGVVIGSAEYRFHLPRALKWQAEPGHLFGEPFRWKPQQPYGSADWDLILRAFFDVGQTIISDAPNAEPSELLMGTGIGVELLYKRNFNVRVDWGFVLNRLDSSSDDIDVGDSRFNILATILF
jgi:hypothetical protein